MRSFSGIAGVFQRTVDKDLRVSPVPVRRCASNTERFGRLLCRQAGEEAELDERCLLRRFLSKPVQRVAYQQDLFSPIVRRTARLVQESSPERLRGVASNPPVGHFEPVSIGSPNHLPRSECVSFHECGGQGDSGALDPETDAAVRDGWRRSTGQELLVP